MSDPAAALAAGLPPGATELAGSLLGVADRRLRALSGRRIERGASAAAQLLVAPRLLDAGWPPPTPPLAVGDGWVHVDVTDDDAETFELLQGTVPDAGPEELAAAAQTWRLPVMPYRRPGAARLVPQAGLDTAADPPAPARPWSDGLARARVLDLTALWAGPLCTSLLAAQGAQVTKVDPSCRPDGFRERPALYRHLNTGKDVVDLDLRRPAGRRRFEDLVRRSDLLVHSFSRRVMPNLGYDHDGLAALNPRIATLAICAFPSSSPERDWLAYGSGVHAASGLGLGLLDDRPRPAPVAYPDPLAGLAAFAVALSLLGTSPRARGGARHLEVSLAGTVAWITAATPHAQLTGART